MADDQPSGEYFEMPRKAELTALRVETINYFIFARWPTGTPTSHAPCVVQKAVASPFSAFHVLYHVYQQGSATRGFAASSGMEAGHCMAFCIVAVPHVEDKLQAAIG